MVSQSEIHGLRRYNQKSKEDTREDKYVPQRFGMMVRINGFVLKPALGETLDPEEGRADKSLVVHDVRSGNPWSATSIWGFVNSCSSPLDRRGTRIGSQQRARITPYITDGRVVRHTCVQRVWTRCRRANDRRETQTRAVCACVKE